MGDLTQLLPTLLPLRGLDVTLRLRRDTRLQAIHQSELTGFVRTLLGEVDGYDTLLTLDTPENDRTFYRQGEHYRFTLLAVTGGEVLLALALERLKHSPHQLPSLGSSLPADSGSNIVLEECRDHFTGAVSSPNDKLSEYGMAELNAEVAYWRQCDRIMLRWLAPVRLLREKVIREQRRLQGEKKFCTACQHLTYPLLAERLHDSLADLLRRRGASPPPRNTNTTLSFPACDLFWIHHTYSNQQGNSQPMGGLMGCQELPPLTALNPADLALWVLGQYLGIGQRRAFGFGRYRLETPSGETRFIRARPTRSLLERAMATYNLSRALSAITTNHDALRCADIDDAEFEEIEVETGTPTDDQQAAESLQKRVSAAARCLLLGQYQPPTLQGVLLRTKQGNLRPLAVPPLTDRILQRAAAQQLTPVLERLFSQASYGFRPGRSRQTARLRIQQAYTAGYRWVYESDIAHFFDSVCWTRLYTRLQAVFGEEPLIDVIMAWISAPVLYRQELIQRRRGLPQGSPLSPVLANLMLDAFDHQLESAGFKLARFADDFVILCKDRAQAETASRAAEQALAEVGLRINPSKTRIRSFTQGFRYLGYLFVEGLALDVGSSDKSLPAAPDGPPPYSWLAELAAREPAALEEWHKLPRQGSAKPRVRRVIRPPMPGKFAESSQRESPPRVMTGKEVDSGRGALAFVTGTPARLASRDNQLLLLRDEQLEQAIPWHTLDGVILFGRHHITTPALRTAMKQGVAIHFASLTGHYQGSTWPATPGPPGWQLWLEQKAVHEDPVRRLAIARVLIEARLRHQREVLRQRVSPNDATGVQIDHALRHLARTRTLDDLRGLEGIATRYYYAGLRQLIPEEWGFDARAYRPSRDPFNALLSLGYTSLRCIADTLLRADGLLPWQGGYHSSQGRHCALASDMMEPFRHLVERTALASVTRRRIKLDEFQFDPRRDCCLLTPEARNRYLGMLMKRFETPITALGAQQAKTAYHHLHAQNQAYMRWLRGQAAEFICFRMR